MAVVQWLKQRVLGEIVVHLNRKQSKSNSNKIANKYITMGCLVIYVVRSSIWLPFYVPGDINQVQAVKCVENELQIWFRLACQEYIGCHAHLCVVGRKIRWPVKTLKECEKAEVSVTTYRLITGSISGINMFLQWFCWLLLIYREKLNARKRSRRDGL